jgi:AcrR family transcriptional regulator
MRPAPHHAQRIAANDPSPLKKKPAAKKATPANDGARVASYAPGGLRDALVAEGRKMFEENGASELSLRAMARRVGVSEAAPSKHFQGKEELLAAIASNGFRELAAQRETLSAKKLAPLPRAREMMMSYVRFAQEHEGLFDLMIGPRVLPEFRRGEFTETGDRSYAFFSNSIFDLARESGWPKSAFAYLSHSAWAVEHGIAALILARRIPRDDSHLELQQLIDYTIDFFLTSVAAGPGDKSEVPMPAKAVLARGNKSRAAK